MQKPYDFCYTWLAGFSQWFLVLLSLLFALYFDCELSRPFRRPSGCCTDAGKSCPCLDFPPWLLMQRAVVTLLLAGLVEPSPLGIILCVKKHTPSLCCCNLLKNLRKNSLIGLGHLPRHRIWESPWVSNINADRVSCPQQHREELSAIDGAVGGWTKEETHEKKVRKTDFFFFSICAWCNNSQKRNEGRKITPFRKPKFDYEWKNKQQLLFYVLAIKHVVLWNL